jgi:uncharacterized protein YhhL (DUF1145 family)
MNQESPLFQSFLYFILVVKILFIFSLVMKLIASRKGDTEKEEKYTHYEENLHNLFTLCMSILLIMLFSTHNKGPVCVDGHTKFFLFVFGILSLTPLLKNFINTKKMKK